jgi:ATP-dependent DNA helicase RecG
MAHPDYIVLPEESETVPAREPVYRTTETLPARTLGRVVRHALERLPDFPEWQDAAYRARQGWLDFASALRVAHAPQSESELEATARPRARLAYDELLANQLALTLIRDSVRRQPGRSLKVAGELPEESDRRPSLQAHGSANQSHLRNHCRHGRAFAHDPAAAGDVGAGKTVVAMAALLNAVEVGGQGAFMAPTELLARQHLASLEGMAKAAGVRVELLTGRERGLQRAAILASLEAGEIHILVGTHAIFSEEVRFRDLALAVVDEQHRFGVHQRMQLQGKGEKPADVLVMTATPIPRTLQLTAYGDMDVSRLTGSHLGGVRWKRACCQRRASTR